MKDIRNSTDFDDTKDFDDTRFKTYERQINYRTEALERRGNNFDRFHRLSYCKWLK